MAINQVSMAAGGFLANVCLQAFGNSAARYTHLRRLITKGLFVKDRSPMPCSSRAQILASIRNC